MKCRVTLLYFRNLLFNPLKELHKLKELNKLKELDQLEELNKPET